jgi:hypothetical protein
MFTRSNICSFDHLDWNLSREKQKTELADLPLASFVATAT